MKKAGCALFGCLGVIGLGIAAAGAFLWLAAPEGGGSSAPGPPPSATAEEMPPEPTSAERPGEPARGRLRLTFHFRDGDDEPRDLSCVLRREDLEREVARFGIAKARMTEELNRALESYLAQEAQRRGVEGAFEIEVYDEGSVRWSYRRSDDADSQEVARIDEFDAWLSHDALPRFAAEADRRYREHGLRLDGDTLKVDYAAQIEDATGPLADCFQALRRLDRDGSRAPIGLFLSFFQDLRYELPPERDEQGRETLGYWVPTAVLSRGAGDCDSKAAAFCALWRQLPARVLLVLVPEHALVAVEGKPGPDQASIRLGNRYYILCEVAGPGRYPPGRTDSSGSFEYITIEPAGSAG